MSCDFFIGVMSLRPQPWLPRRKPDFAGRPSVGSRFRDVQARFILEAVLPAVSERCGYNFSSDPKKRAIIGESSGGNAAFTVAGEHPDAFHRMMGHSSSFSFGPLPVSQMSFA